MLRPSGLSGKHCYPLCSVNTAHQSAEFYPRTGVTSYTLCASLSPLRSHSAYFYRKTLTAGFGWWCKNLCCHLARVGILSFDLWWSPAQQGAQFHIRRRWSWVTLSWLQRRPFHRVNTEKHLHYVSCDHLQYYFQCHYMAKFSIKEADKNAGVCDDIQEQIILIPAF